MFKTWTTVATSQKIGFIRKIQICNDDWLLIQRSAASWELGPKAAATRALAYEASPFEAPRRWGKPGHDDWESEAAATGQPWTCPGYDGRGHGADQPTKRTVVATVGGDGGGGAFRRPPPLPRYSAAAPVSFTPRPSATPAP